MRIAVLTLAVLAVAGSAWAQSARQIGPEKVINVPAGPRGKPPVISAVAISPDGRLLAAAGDDHFVRVFEAQSGRLLHSLTGHNDWVRALAFSPDSRVLASGGDDRRVLLWDPQRGQLTSEADAPGFAVYGIDFSRDGARLAVCGFADVVKLYDPGRGALLANLKAAGHDQRCVAFSPDGRLLAAAGRTGTVRLWDAGGERVQENLEITKRRLWSLAFSPDGTLLAAGGEDRSLHVIEVRTGRQLGDYQLAGGKIQAVAFCTRDLVAVGCTGNTIDVLQSIDGSPAARLAGHAGSIPALSYDNTRHRLFSGSFDTTVRVWDVGGANVARRPAPRPSR